MALSDTWGLSVYTFKHTLLYEMLPSRVFWKPVILSWRGSAVVLVKVKTTAW